MAHKRHEHRRGVEQHIPDEGADPAHREGVEGFEQHRGGHDDHVVQIHVASRDRDAQRGDAHDDVHGHQDRGGGQFFYRQMRVFHAGRPLDFSVSRIIMGN